MATFACPIIRYAATPHPNADRLEIGRFGDYQFVTGRDQFSPGDLGAYIPEGAIVPADILDELGLTGKLAGSAHNRVKAISLRGVLSQGLFYPAMGARWNPAWREGEDVASDLGVTKYVAPLPSSFMGETVSFAGDPIRFDVENIKRYPEVLRRGEQVSLTEKLHGTCCILGYDQDGKGFVTSKGLAARGLALCMHATNVYWRAVLAADLFAALAAMRDGGIIPAHDVVLLGEVYGPGVQDLGYGLALGHLAFRAFDVCIRGRYWGTEMFRLAMDFYRIPRVPEVYRGPWLPEMLPTWTNGESALAAHIREGIVIRPMQARTDPELGRVILKSVSEAYLTRKNADASEHE